MYVCIITTTRHYGSNQWTVTVTIVPYKKARARPRAARPPAHANVKDRCIGDLGGFAYVDNTMYKLKPVHTNVPVIRQPKQSPLLDVDGVFVLPSGIPYSKL